MTCNNEKLAGRSRQLLQILMGASCIFTLIAPAIAQNGLASDFYRPGDPIHLGAVHKSMFGVIGDDPSGGDSTTVAADHAQLAPVIAQGSYKPGDPIQFGSVHKPMFTEAAGASTGGTVYGAQPGTSAPMNRVMPGSLYALPSAATSTANGNWKPGDPITFGAVHKPYSPGDNTAAAPMSPPVPSATAYGANAPVTSSTYLAPPANPPANSEQSYQSKQNPPSNRAPSSSPGKLASGKSSRSSSAGDNGSQNVLQMMQAGTANFFKAFPKAFNWAAGFFGAK